MLGKSAHGEDGIVGLDNDITDFFGIGKDGECVKDLLREMVRDLLQQHGAKSRASTTCNRMAKEESLRNKEKGPTKQILPPSYHCHQLRDQSYQ